MHALFLLTDALLFSLFSAPSRLMRTVDCNEQLFPFACCRLPPSTSLFDALLMISIVIATATASMGYIDDVHTYVTIKACD